ncbi:MAG TPA: septum formation inhibitor Maf [Leucothrix mucor]|nr:septum formation inhibitor Maf [Leucothrix mucor]
MNNSTNPQTIILASASPRRAELLDQIGVNYQIQVADINEDANVDESPESLVKRLAKQKAEKISLNNRSTPVLGADTLGVLKGVILNKPRDFDHAYEMLSAMSGNWHEILSAVALSYQGVTTVLLNKNRVFFKALSDQEIKSYWQTGEPQDKAGAYAIQGLAATFIERIEGSYSGIMGLPLFETNKLLKQARICPENESRL